ncbi:MAG: IS1634 family transposase, partial [Candidatus Aenigmarchaeota archaeon]|nr:IS1634 family transposase [Candidatus Aenigmarchaeota archaeon]
MDNKCRHKLIINLGPVNSDNDMAKYKQILKSMKQKDEFINLKDIKICSAKNYGVYHATCELLEKYELDTILKKQLNSGKHVFDVFQIIKALIVNRLEDPCSKLSAYDWMKNEYPEEINPELQNLYFALDKLIQHKEDIEIKIFQTLKDKLNLNTKKVHYDLTSSYFEGHNCQIAMYGYSRDHRPDRKQIVIGLVMVDGIPIYHEVFEGNTADKSTLSGIVEKLKTKFNLKSPTIIADRGLITQENLQMLETNEQEYILGFSKRNNNLTKELIVQDIKSNKNQIAKIIKIEDKRKYVLCLDNNTRNERLEILKNTKENINGGLNKLKTKFEKSQASDKKNKITTERLILQINKILGKNRRLFNLDYSNETFSFDVNAEAWEYEQKSAGKFLL